MSELLPVEVNEKWGYIDKSGTVTIKPQFVVAGVFSEGLAPVRLMVNGDSLIRQVSLL